MRAETTPGTRLEFDAPTEEDRYRPLWLRTIWEASDVAKEHGVENTFTSPGKPAHWEGEYPTLGTDSFGVGYEHYEHVTVYHYPAGPDDEFGSRVAFIVAAYWVEIIEEARRRAEGAAT